jgi:DNA-binding transcriptional LysR family regulator
MEIRQLKAFLAIAEARTFTAAAQRVHYTQAALSMQIKQLEKEVGVPLFVRMPRRVVMTEASAGGCASAARRATSAPRRCPLS